jgi:hypothetical protein
MEVMLYFLVQGRKKLPIQGKVQTQACKPSGSIHLQTRSDPEISIRIEAGRSYLQPLRSAYQPPGSSTFLSEQTIHQQPANSTFLLQQTSTSHQPNEHTVRLGAIGL